LLVEKASIKTMHVILIYLGILVGVFFEGELIMISSIIAAFQGYLNPWVVIAIGITGTFFSDFFYFSLGKKKGAQLIERKNKLKLQMEKIGAKIHKFPFLIFMSYRFMYGFRVVTPLVIGTSNFHTGRFIINSFSSILLWATAYSLVGYFLGSYIISKLSHIEHIEMYIVVVLVIVASVFILIKRRKMKKSQI
jgi:membrane protein DedA with SNARE-associated domain